VTPRPYRMQARQASAEETRARIIEEARALLSAPRGIEAFTIDSVARKAGVSRMTVYHQFESKTGLIEAVFDSLAIVRVGVPRLVAALGLADPRETLATFVQVFAEVWQADRVVIRRLQGLAALDSEFARVWHTREERRREGLRMIVARLSAQRAGKSRVRADAISPDEAMLTDVLYAIIAFETYDVIAGPKRRFETIVPVIHRLALTTLGLGAPPTTGRAGRRGVSR
jgi:AcrR family transcriptional regulator